jgi:tetratricopeptide (TPR) repeat protein
VIGATVVGVIIVVAVAIGLFLGYEASKARARAEAELTRAEAANDFLEDFILASNPFAAEGYATEEDSLLARLDYGAANLADALGNYPETEAELRIALATSYKGLGRADKAVEQAELALEIAVEAGGEESELALEAMNRVGLYLGTTDPERAIEVLERFGEIAPEVLGAEDALTLSGRHNLALTYKRVGRYGDAEPIYKDVLKIRRRVLGKQAEATLITASTLAKLYEDSGRLSEAEPLAREVLRGHEEIYGEDHPETLLSVDGLGSVLRRLGKYDEAAALHERALEGMTEQLGPTHESTLGARYFLAQVQVLQGAHSEAEETFRELYEICREQFGPIDGYTVASLIGLTESLRAQDRPGEAEGLLAPVLPKLVDELGWDHSRTWNLARELGFALQDMEEHEEAIQRLSEVIEAAGRALPEDDLRLITMEMYVGKSLVALGDYEQAEPILRKVDRLLESDLREQAPTRVGLEGLVELLEATGRDAGRYGEILKRMDG